MWSQQLKIGSLAINEFGLKQIVRPIIKPNPFIKKYYFIIKQYSNSMLK